MKVGLFGGSFDPIHRGHLEPVRHARTALGLDRVIYLPTARPPHKLKLRAVAHQRYAMVEMALLEEEGMYASPFEMRGETCYTIDTVEHFSQELPESQLVLLIGADSWAAFSTWRRWRHILAKAELAVLLRPGWEAGSLEPPFDQAFERGRLHFVPNEPWPVSSSELRRRFEHGENVHTGSVPRLVLNYIAKYELYRPA